MNKIGCCLLCAAAVSLAVRAEVQTYPAAGNWENVVIKKGGGYTWVNEPSGRAVAFFCAVPDSDRLTPLIVVSNTASALHLDVRPAFAAGAVGVSIYTSELKCETISGNDSVTARVDWEGPCGMKMRDILIADRTDGTGWNEGSEFVSGFLRRRESEHTFNVPEVKKIFHRVDILSVGGGDGVPAEFKLYGIRTGNFAELGTPCPVRSGPPELLFHASFDQDARADFARGAPDAVRSEHVTFVPGRKNGGVRFSASDRSALAWKCRRNIDPRHGTVAFWLKKEEKDLDRWRSLFYCPGADVRGGGTIDFWEMGRQIRLDRHDLDNWHDYVLEDWIPKRGDRWCHYIFTWDSVHTGLYVNGRPVPDWADATHGDDYSPQRAALKDTFVHLFDRRKGSFSVFNLGNKNGDYGQNGIFDELKIFSQAMTAREAYALAVSEGVKTENDPVVVSTGPNPYEAPAEEKPGLVSRLRLVRRVRPAVDVPSSDSFTCVGTLVTNVLDGIPYLEAGARQNDRFAVRFQIDPAKPLYCFEVDYPDNRKRTAEFIVQRSKRPAGDYTLQSGVFCGDEYTLSGKMRTDRYVYWTSDADVTFIATTLRKDEPAAVAEIRLYEVTDGRLPAACTLRTDGVPRRSFMNDWEDPAFLDDFGTKGGAAAFSDQVDRLAAYMKFCGQDALAFPACFYGGRIGESGYNPRRLPVGYFEAFCEKFDREGLSVIPAINQQVVPLASDFVTRASMLNGSLHPTEIAILSTGKPNWGGWHGSPPNFNIAHPAVQAEFVRLVRNFAAEGRNHTSFKGVSLHLAQVNPLWFGSFSCGYNDYCIDAFTKATGIEVPVDRADPLRGKAYAAWLTAHARAQWIDWRCGVVAAFYARLAAELRAARGDLRLFVKAMPDPSVPNFLEAGFDPEKIRAADPSIVIGMTGFPAGTRVLSCPLPVSPKWTRAYDWAHFHDIYWENPIGAQRIGKDVLSNAWLDETTWRVSALHPCGAHALRHFADALARADVKTFSCGGFLIGTLGTEPELAAFMRAFRTLPAVDFTDAPSSPKGWVVRTARTHGRDWEYRVQTVPPYRLEVSDRPAACSDTDSR